MEYRVSRLVAVTTDVGSGVSCATAVTTAPRSPVCTGRDGPGTAVRNGIAAVTAGACPATPPGTGRGTDTNTRAAAATRLRMCVESQLCCEPESTRRRRATTSLMAQPATYAHSNRAAPAN